MSKEMSKKETNIAMPDYGELAGTGFEGTTSDDLIVPLIQVLQPLSPQVEENEPEGSKPGLLFNSVTQELSEKLVLQPVHKVRYFAEWVPRKAGGGFVAAHEPSSDVVIKAIEENGGSVYGDLKVGENDLVETHDVFCMTLNEDGTETTGFCVIPATSTKITKIKKWFTSMYMLKGKPPIFANRAILTTVKQKNEQGTYYNINVSPLKSTWVESLIDPKKETSLIEEAIEFRKSVLDGRAKAATPPDERNSKEHF